MDVVTHGLAGALVAGTASRRPDWPTVAAGIGGAMAPDLDALARLWDPLATITVHRTATHSLLGGVALALAVAAVVRLGTRGGRFPSLAYSALFGVLTHVGLDLLNPFGTAILWPFEGRRFGLGWLYVIDPAVIALVLVGLAFAYGGAAFRPRPARAAFLAVGIYAAVAGIASQRAEAQFRGLLRDAGLTPSRVVLVPVFPGPVRWMGVAETAAAAHRARFWLGPRPPVALTAVPMPPPESLPGVEALPAVQKFRAFARIPWRTVSRHGDAQIVEYQDLAFEDHPWGGPMTLRLTIDPSGTVRGVDLGHKF